jgi:hypothetical protein
MPVNNVRGIESMVSNLNEFTVNQAPFAMAKALTDTAKMAQVAVTEHINTVFDRPTAFTKMAMAFTPSNKIDLKSSVYVKELQASYLIDEVLGGMRGFKSFEEKFGGVSALAYAMPGKDVKRNQYGNMSKAQIIKLAKGLASDTKSKSIFRGVSKTNPALQIIYARGDGNTKLLPQLIFTSHAKYQPRFKFKEVVQATVEAKFVTNFQSAWTVAIKSKRG